MKVFAPIIQVVILFALLNLSALAQRSGGSLIGTVTDSSGAAVSRARIVVQQQGPTRREAVSNERGEFGLTDLVTGDYLLTVEAEGLSQVNGAQKFRVDGNTATHVSVRLQVAAIRDALIVSATRTEMSASESPSSVYVISRERPVVVAAGECA